MHQEVPFEVECLVAEELPVRILFDTLDPVNLLFVILDHIQEVREVRTEEQANLRVFVQASIEEIVIVRASDNKFG